MSEPDELYTLRAQFWLGHYQMALDEAKAMARRPLSPALKEERDFFLARSQLALGLEVSDTSTPALQAVQLLSAMASSAEKEATLDSIKQLVASHPSPTTHLIAAQACVASDQLAPALALLQQSTTMLEPSLLVLQIYLKLDRLDLAQQQLDQMKQQDEDSILVQLASVYVFLYKGSSGAKEALFVLQSLTEQYGTSSFLLNLVACAHLQAGDYAQAEAKLRECEDDTTTTTTTMVNLVTALVHQHQSPEAYVAQWSEPQVQGLLRVQTALDREAVKYQALA